MKLRVFLHDHLLEKILNAGPDWPRVLVWGGPGLGKTAFLECLRDELMGSSELGTPVLILRRAADARERIRAWTADPKGVLLIDDLDHLFNNEIEESLRSLPEENTGTWRIIATAGNIDAIEERADWSGSPSLNTFHRERLDPWERSWQARAAIKDALERTRGKLLQTSDPERLPSFILVPDSPVSDAWLETILEVSGGHPALVDSAFEGFLNLVKNFPDLRPDLITEPLSDPRDWQTSIQGYLEDYVVDHGMVGINKAIRSFKKNKRKFSHLVRLATGGGQAAIIHDAVVRYSLRDSGLVYTSHETGRLVIASELIRQRILAIAEETTPRHRKTGRGHGEAQRIQIKVVASASLPEVRGKLCYETEQHEQGEVALSGGPWRILKCLAEVDGPISVKDLGDGASLGTESATRSTIQRLLRVLRREGISDVLENVRGVGYRLGEEPVLWEKNRARDSS